MKPLLLIAHPGHELRLLEWVRRKQPHIAVLTHGDGSLGQPRLADTQAVMASLQVQVRSDWLQPVADSVVYQALLKSDVALLQQWMSGLVAAGLRGEFDAVVADEAEGYNPTHDLCRVLANQLVVHLARAGRPVPCLEFPLIAHPSDPAREASCVERVLLNEAELVQKLHVMRRYAEQCSPVLVRELQTMLEVHGEAAFAKECLYAAAPTPYEGLPESDWKPHFEQVGEAKLLAGTYSQVIRAAHLRQLVKTWQQATEHGH